MILPGDIRIKKNTEQRAKYFREHPEKTWKTNLTQKDIDDIEAENKLSDTDIATLRYLRVGGQIHWDND